MKGSGPDQDLCNHCRDWIDCNCNHTCEDLGTCPHGCYLSKYTKPQDTGDFLDRAPQTERDVLVGIKRELDRFGKQIEQALNLVPAREDLYTTEDADLLQSFMYDGLHFDREHIQEILKILAPHIPDDINVRLEKLVSDYNSRTEVFDHFNAGLVIGNNRTRDGKHQWTEIRIVLPTGVPDDKP